MSPHPLESYPHYEQKKKKILIYIYNFPTSQVALEIIEPNIYIYIYIVGHFIYIYGSIISNATWLVGKFHRFEVKKRGEGRSSNSQSWLSIKKKKKKKKKKKFVDLLYKDWAMPPSLMLNNAHSLPQSSNTSLYTYVNCMP
jgi:hypothetical protein